MIMKETKTIHVRDIYKESESDRKRKDCNAR